MIITANNHGYTLAQANQQFLHLLKEGNATLTKLEQVGRECLTAKEKCAAVQKAHAQELAELTEGIKKLDAIFNNLIKGDGAP